MALNVARGMNEMSFDPFYEDARSTIRELANISTGHTVTTIQDEHDSLSIDISPPPLFVGNRIEFRMQESKETVRIPLRTNYGDLALNIASEKH